MKKGFTLIELLLVITLLLLLGTMGTAFTGRFLTQNAVENTTDQLVNNFRKAQLNAMTGKQNSNWGVNYSANTITLYKGTSYAARTVGFDEKFTTYASVSISGFSDINFTRETGIPSAAATITITDNKGSTNTITLNAQGAVTR